ncbi:MAG: hypothetical protein HFJ12_03255 [Bacilli bacterium]|nr:hypothetical protein [Bacilli bacterium]
MKKNYEKNQLIISISFIFIILCTLFLTHIFTYRYRSYQVLDSILISKNYIKLMITTKELTLLKKSNFILIDNTKRKIEITHVQRNVLKRKVSYHDVIIRVKTPKKYHDGDYMKVTVYEQKRRMIHIFKSCWKE